MSPGLYGTVLESVRTQLRERGQWILAAAEDEVRKTGLTVERHLIETVAEAAGPKIVEEAAQCGADIIVCGTHGRRGLSHVLLGSDAEFVVRHARIPVLMVPLASALAKRGEHVGRTRSRK